METALAANRFDAADAACFQALQALDQQTENVTHDPVYRRERAVLLEMAGRIRAGQGLLNEAVGPYKEAIDLFSKRLAEDPGSDDDRQRLATALARLGTLYDDLGRWHEAESTFFRGRMLCEQVPGTRLLDARILMARALFQTRSAQSLLKLGRRPQALECATAAMNTLADPSRLLEGGADVGEEIVPLFIDLGRLFTSIGELAAAERGFTIACDLADRLRNLLPASSRHEDLAATAWAELASARKRDPERRRKVVETLMRSLAIRESLVARFPSDAGLRSRLADTYASLGCVFYDQKELERAEAVGRQEIACRAHAMRNHSDPSSNHDEYGRALHNQADLIRLRGRAREALVLEEQAVTRLGQVYRENLCDPLHRRAISNALWTLCSLRLDCGDPRGTELAVRDYLEIEPSGYEEALESTRFLCRCLDLYKHDPSLTFSERERLTQRCAGQAISALAIAVQNGYHDAAELAKSAVYGPLRGRADFESLVRSVEFHVAAAGDGANH